MKKTLLLVLAVIISIAFVTTVFAQDAAKTAPDKKAVTEKIVAKEATAAPTADVKAPAPKKEKMRARGEVVSVDAAAKTLVIKSKKGEMTFDVANAKFGRGFKIEDAKAGDKVVVGYKEIDGKMVAKYVGKHRHHGKKHHKKEATETKETKPAEAAPK
ncbi:MAG: hypothetical protein C0392_07825 [Syntrophus sp. (in: bacteria)]|nr:hypothetical protein [Syntrophus sp. (in: bacteria)]